MDLPLSSYHDSLEELWDEEEEPEEIETVMKVVSSVYPQDLDVFSKAKAERLPPHGACDHHIELQGSLLPEKKYLVPPMNQLLTVCNCSSIFSNIDSGGAYNLLRIKAGDEHLKCFRTRYGISEHLIMPFVLTNAPPSFENLVNSLFYDLINTYVVVYLDDIMFFSKSVEEHVPHVSTVLSRVKANKLFAYASKCLFHVSSVENLGYIASSEGLNMDQEKVQKILNGPPPRNLKDLQSFLFFANFYQCFIKNYSKNISSLTILLKKASCFALNEEALRQFHQLKEAFTTVPIFFYPPLWRSMHPIMHWVLYCIRFLTQENIPFRFIAASLFQQSSNMKFIRMTPLNSLGPQALEGFSSFSLFLI
ncbi:hypothetical protein O181_017291 [Austropuccinia psidii MF-1]|uniref:Reverse transcriptase domain-containing protein n=1 Tax=Austropuccinia psidii MF-1 TaxID=1389203 RepID=A0A9Q3C7B3_9BASI|nr:hypothetical protein [Austropuccinia psidii MF-1]